jgi:Phage head-tail joining protein
MTWPYPVLPYGQTVTLLHRTVTGQDEFGNDVYESTPETVGNVAVQPGSHTERVGSFTDQATTSLQIFLPNGTDITYLDAIVWNGDTYEVTGEPALHVSPFSGHAGPIRVTATIVKGASP